MTNSKRTGSRSVKVDGQSSALAGEWKSSSQDASRMRAEQFAPPHSEHSGPRTPDLTSAMSEAASTK